MQRMVQRMVPVCGLHTAAASQDLWGESFVRAAVGFI
jgi:hypothetical protein